MAYVIMGLSSSCLAARIVIALDSDPTTDSIARISEPDKVKADPDNLVRQLTNTLSTLLTSILPLTAIQFSS